ncbi:unnamed protein product [Eruca vesicaria subsp. sativa]|uniref:dAMP1 SANT/Myb-like domain-containing protein n=1 Tax=Eruca vesicaria subsp. sativa TaxID=29727 RepID=A0ABC8IZN4_ERUVS|nr:unnamed protein product [Eruca vesicaria subsp. sativa]
MGGTDAKDILGLPKTPLSLGRPDGISLKVTSRNKQALESIELLIFVELQVYALTGGVAPLMPSIDVTDLLMTSSARKDDLVLYHWVRVVNNVPPTGDYSFAIYNKSVDIFKYKDDEYENYLTDHVSDTKEDTYQLFELFERFDLLFTFITDRFSLPRTVEELKDRYYSNSLSFVVTRALLRARAQSPPHVANHPLMKSRHEEKKDAEILAEAKRITEMRLAARRGADPDVSGNENIGLDKADGGPRCSVSTSSNSQLPATSVAPSTLTMADYASTLASLRMLHVYLRTYGLEQMVQAASSAVGLRTIKRVEQTLQDLGVNLKPKVPTKTLQYKESEGSLYREGSYAAMPDTPKDGVFACEPFSFGGTFPFIFSGPGRQAHFPSPAHRRPRKLKASEL